MVTTLVITVVNTMVEESVRVEVVVKVLVSTDSKVLVSAAVVVVTEYPSKDEQKSVAVADCKRASTFAEADELDDIEDDDDVVSEFGKLSVGDELEALVPATDSMTDPDEELMLPDALLDVVFAKNGADIVVSMELVWPGATGAPPETEEPV